MHDVDALTDGGMYDLDGTTVVARRYLLRRCQDSVCTCPRWVLRDGTQLRLWVGDDLWPAHCTPLLYPNLEPSGYTIGNLKTVEDIQDVDDFAIPTRHEQGCMITETDICTCGLLHKLFVARRVDHNPGCIMEMGGSICTCHEYSPKLTGEYDRQQEAITRLQELNTTT